jgi:hypothetical protein
MSFSLAWFAVHGLDRDEFLELAGYEDTGEPDEYFEAEHSGGELSGGWYVLVSAELDQFNPEVLADMSAGARLVAAVVHEGSMTSVATEWRDGRQVWAATHDGSEGGDTLEIEGEMPGSLERLLQEAKAAEAAEPGLDHVFDVPLKLAEEITGFRHDVMGFDPDAAPFTALEKL